MSFPSGDRPTIAKQLLRVDVVQIGLLLSFVVKTKISVPRVFAELSRTVVLGPGARNRQLLRRIKAATALVTFRLVTTASQLDVCVKVAVI